MLDLSSPNLFSHSRILKILSKGTSIHLAQSGFPALCDSGYAILHVNNDRADGGNMGVVGGRETEKL